MKRELAASVAFFAALVLGCAAVAGTAEQRTLTSLQEIHALNNDEASQGIPVAFEGSVTYFEDGNVDLFVQDGDAAVYVETNPKAKLQTGDRVLVVGKTRASFRP